MASSLPLETQLEDIFVKKAPALPDGGKKWLVQYLPWLCIIGGVLSLWSAWALWQAAHYVSKLVDTANEIYGAYGIKQSVNELTFAFWLGLAVVVAEGVIYFMAYSGLRDRKKAGWNLLYIGSLLNLAYGLVVMFTSYGGPGNFIGSLIGTAIGLWLLFQIRASYTEKGAPAAPVAPAAPKAPEAK